MDQASRWPRLPAARPTAGDILFILIPPPNRVNIKSVTAPAPNHPATEASAAPPDFFGHPRGLAILFATETWERFSYFGNAALALLYMVEYLLLPGQVEAVIGYGGVRSALEAVFGPLERSRSPLSFSASTRALPTPPRSSAGSSPTACSASAAPSSSADVLMASATS